MTMGDNEKETMKITEGDNLLIIVSHGFIDHR